MSQKRNLQKLIKNHQTRLQKLKETQALQGINTPPEISIEIADIESKIDELYQELEKLENEEKFLDRPLSPTIYVKSEAFNSQQLSSNTIDTESSKPTFQINYKFVHPYLPTNDDALGQVLVSFTSRKDIEFSKIEHIPTHLCLVIDVSGSMDQPDKYPLLRQAIPNLIDSLSDADYLTIILFSMGSDTVIAALPISHCRQQIQSILNSIDNSGMMFGYQTLLSDSLKDAISEIEYFRQQIPKSINRLYILTDGEIHDAEDCYRLNSKLRTLETEINSYGFGKDFALETIKNITEGIPGSGKVKPILNTEDVQLVFSHIGNVAQKIIAQDAELTFVFEDRVIAGDAFSYLPSQEYFGTIDNQTKMFSLKLGTLEMDRTYTFFFEGTLPAMLGIPQDKNNQVQKISKFQQFAKAILRYRRGSTWEESEVIVNVQRSSDVWRHEKTDKSALEIYQVLDATRKKDPETKLQSLLARLSIYEREKADPMMIELIQQAISKLERGEDLTVEEDRGLLADDCTQVKLAHHLILRNMAETWLMKGYSSERIEWLLQASDSCESIGFPNLLDSLDQIESLVVERIIDSEGEVDPLARSDSDLVITFDALINERLND